VSRLIPILCMHFKNVHLISCGFFSNVPRFTDVSRVQIIKKKMHSLPVANESKLHTVHLV
jgi:hypothetical protein